MRAGRRLRTWEEIVGNLRDVRLRDGHLELVFETVLIISDFDENLLTILKKMVGHTVAILKTDDGKYKIRQVME